MTRFASAPWPLKAAYLAALAAFATALLLALGAVVALAGLGRLSADIDPAAVPGWLWYFRGDLLVRRWVAAGLGSSLSLAGLIVVGVLKARRPPLHGAARWANEADLVRGGLRANRGIVLGRKGGRLLVFDGEDHVLLYAPTRTGKGVGVVIPNLLTWPDSVVVLDIKRENWEASAGFRAAHGQSVIRFDPLDPQGRTARFNPLGHIDRQDPLAVIDELQKLAVMLLPTAGHADPFWVEAARTGLIGVGAYVAATPDLPFSLGAIYGELTCEDPRARLPAIVAARARSGNSLPAGCVSALADFCSASEKTFAGVKLTLTSRLSLWLSWRVRAATDVSDFDLGDLRKRRISLYLCVSPDNMARVAPLYSLLAQQLIDLNTRERPSAGRHDVQVLVLLDEFARLGYAGAIAQGFSYVAGYGLRLLPVLQSPAQLRAQYGPDLAEEIIANCGVEVAFAPKDLKVAQNLSERLGYWTYQGRSLSRPALLSRGHRSTTQSDQRRALMMPQELLQMDSDRLIVLRSGLAPVLGHKITYWREKDFAQRVLPPPKVAPYAGYAPAPGPNAPATPIAPGPPRPKRSTRQKRDDLTLDLPLSPPKGPPLAAADDQTVKAWVDRFVDDVGRSEPGSGRQD